MSTRRSNKVTRVRIVTSLAIGTLAASLGVVVGIADAIGDRAEVAISIVTALLFATTVTFVASAADVRSFRRERSPLVFLSYSASDQERIRAITSQMDKIGVRTWDPAEQIRPGDRLTDRVSRGLDESDVVVVFFSDDVSPWITYELGRAQEAGKRILPVALTRDGLEHAHELTPDISYVDASEGLEGVMDRLLGGLKASNDAWMTS